MWIISNKNKVKLFQFSLDPKNKNSAILNTANQVHPKISPNLQNAKAHTTRAPAHNK